MNNRPEFGHHDFEGLVVSSQVIDELRQLCQEGAGTFVEADPSTEGKVLDDFPEMHHITVKDQRQKVGLIIHPNGFVKHIAQTVDGGKFYCTLMQSEEGRTEDSAAVELSFSELQDIPPALRLNSLDSITLNLDRDEKKYIGALTLKFSGFTLHFEIEKRYSDPLDQLSSVKRRYSLPTPEGRTLTGDFEFPSLPGITERERKDEIAAARKIADQFQVRLSLRNGVPLLEIEVGDKVVEMTMQWPSERMIEGLVRSLKAEKSDEQPRPSMLIPLNVQEKDKN